MDATRVLARATALGRVVSPRLASNRFALLALAVGTVLATVLAFTSDPPTSIVASLGTGVRYGLAAFLTWALARELDPDRPSTARYATLLYAPAALVDEPQVLAAVAAMLAVRLVVRSVGPPPRPLDLVVLVLLAGAASQEPTGFVAALAVAAALVVDHGLPQPHREPRPPGLDPRLLGAGAAVVVAIAVMATGGGMPVGWAVPDTAGWVLLGVLVVAVLALPAPRVHATADATKAPLLVRRVQAARWLAAAVAVVAFAWAGAPALGGMAPAVCALAATTVVGRARRFRAQT